MSGLIRLGKYLLKSDTLRGLKLDYDLLNAGSGRVAVEAGTKFTPRVLKWSGEERDHRIYCPTQRYIRAVCI